MSRFDYGWGTTFELTDGDALKITDGERWTLLNPERIEAIHGDPETVTITFVTPNLMVVVDLTNPDQDEDDEELDLNAWHQAIDVIFKLL